MDIHVDIRGFLKSMHGYAMDSRTRVSANAISKLHCVANMTR